MKKNAYGLTLAFALLFSAAVGLLLVNSATANFIYLPTITIKSDGSIEPQTEFINQTGNVYTLMTNLSQQYSITIKCSNIVFDGAGHVLNGSASDFGCSNTGLSLEGVTNVTVKDLSITGFMNTDISIGNCSGCYIFRVTVSRFGLRDGDFNTIAESSISTSLGLGFSGNNLITETNITGVLTFYFSHDNSATENSIASIFVISSDSNILFENNFLCENNYFQGKTNFWDNGSVGNYWSDYLAKYPNASEIGNTGIGDTPYVIDADNVDYYPLMCPYDIENDAIAFPTPEPQPEPFPTALVIAAVAGVTVSAIGLPAYFKKRKH